MRSNHYIFTVWDHLGDLSFGGHKKQKICNSKTSASFVLSCKLNTVGYFGLQSKKWSSVYPKTTIDSKKPLSSTFVTPYRVSLFLWTLVGRRHQWIPLEIDLLSRTLIKVELISLLEIRIKSCCHYISFIWNQTLRYSGPLTDQQGDAPKALKVGLWNLAGTLPTLISQSNGTNCSAPIDATPSKTDVGWSIDMVWA